MGEEESEREREREWAEVVSNRVYRINTQITTEKNITNETHVARRKILNQFFGWKLTFKKEMLNSVVVLYRLVVAGVERRLD